MITTINTFLQDYFQSKTDGMSLGTVLKYFWTYVTQQFFMGTEGDPDNVFDATVYLLDLFELSNTGELPEVTPLTNYLVDTVQLLVQTYDTKSDTPSQTLVQYLGEIQEIQNLVPNLLDFPSINWASYTAGDPHLVLTVHYNLADNAPIPTLDDWATWMTNVYQDSMRGVYSILEDPKPLSDVEVMELPSTPTPVTFTDDDNTTTVIGYTVDLPIKMSFMVSLRELVKDRNIFKTHIPVYENFDMVRVNESVPMPATYVNDQECADSPKSCKCLYFSAFGAYECPGAGYYFCQFYDKCRCIITRAVPTTTPLLDRVNNKFGLCFDLNCQDPPADCTDQCDQAKAWLKSPNWFNNFVNPAAVDVKLIEKTCGFKVPEFASAQNTYIWTPQIIVGGLCFFLSIPVLIMSSSLLNRKFSASFLQVLVFLFLVGAGIVFGYALSGVQKCHAFNKDPGQAPCVDRLTQNIELNHMDCDTSAPIFCQCDASRDNQRVCDEVFPGQPTCKCQNNQVCIPGDGLDSALEPAPVTRRMIQGQLLYMCVGIFVLLGPLGMLALRFLPGMSGMSKWLKILVYLLYFVFVFGVVVVFPVVWKYYRDWDRTLQINLNDQKQMCVE